MAGKVVSNDDQLQIAELVFFVKFGLQCRKSLNDAHQILMWTDPPRIEHKGIIHQVALAATKTGVGCVPGRISVASEFSGIQNNPWARCRDQAAGQYEN